MPRSQEIEGRRAQSKRMKRRPALSNSSMSSKGKKRKTQSNSMDLGLSRWDDERNYTSSESSGQSSGSTVVLDDASSSSPLRDHLPIHCPHKSLGCCRFFYSYVDRNRHAKNCIFSFFKSCQEPSCENKVFVGTFADYLEHTHTDHSVPLITAANHEPLTIPMNGSADFYTPSDRAYSTKVLAGIEQKTESENFNLALYALVKAMTYTTPVMSVVPVIYACNKQVYHFVRLKLALQLTRNDSNEMQQFPVLPVISGMRHPSHVRNGGYQVISPAFNSPEQIMTALQSYKLISYATENTKKANEMSVAVEFCRVQLKHEKKLKLRPYFLTWEETNLQMRSRELLPDSQKEEPDPITAVLLPQLKGKHNILLEFIDESHVLRLIIAQVLDQILEEGIVVGARNPKLIVLYPDDLTLTYDGSKLKKFILRAGISAVVIASSNLYPVEKFEKYGTDILLSTPEALQEFVQKQPGSLENMIFSNLRYIVLPLADHKKRVPNTQVIGDILGRVPEVKRNNIARLAITPYLHRTLVHLLRQQFFGGDYKLLSIGDSPASQIRAMKVVDEPADTEAKKIQQVLKILAEGIKGRWLILANELAYGYSTTYEKLFAQLEQAYDIKKLSMVRTMAEARSTPNAFDEFKLEPDGILLTSYFSFLFFNVIRLCDGIILFTMPFSKTDLARLTTIARMEDGTLKPIYNLKDYLSPNKITADYFVD